MIDIIYNTDIKLKLLGLRKCEGVNMRQNSVFLNLSTLYPGRKSAGILKIGAPLGVQ